MKTLNFLSGNIQGMTKEEINELIPFGFAPGNYLIPKCHSCGEEFTADKRANVCRPCAEKAKTEHESNKKLPKKGKVIKIGDFDANGFPIDWEIDPAENYGIYIPAGTWNGLNDPELLKVIVYFGYKVEELRKIKETNNPDYFLQ